MATRNLRLNYGDGTGPGKVGEMLFWPMSPTNNVAGYWQADSPARIALQYRDPDHAASDPAYAPDYTILGAGKYALAPVTVGAVYGVDIIRINGTIDQSPAFSITIPAGSGSLDISTLTPSAMPAPTADQILDAAVASRVSSGALTGAAVDARTNKLTSRTTGQTVALLGASRTFNESVGVGIYDPVTTVKKTTWLGAFSVANMLTGHRMTMVKNAGIGGNTSAQILARLTDVTGLAQVPAICIVSDLPSNDAILGTPTSWATVQANSEAIVQGLLDAGISVVLCTAMSITGLGTAGKLLMAQSNRWVKAQGARKGVRVADIAAVVTDPVTGDPLSGSTIDGTHGNNVWGRRAGAALALALRPLTYGTVDLASSNADPLSKTPTPMLTGTTGALTTGVTGVVADNAYVQWSGTAGTGVASLVARTEHGNWQQIQMTGGGVLLFGQLLTSGLTAGEQVHYECEIDVDGDWTGLKYITAELLASSGPQAFDLVDEEVSPPPGSIDSSFSGVLRTPTITLGTESYLLGGVLISGGTGTIRIGRSRIVKDN